MSFTTAEPLPIWQAAMDPRVSLPDSMMFKIGKFIHNSQGSNVSIAHITSLAGNVDELVHPSTVNGVPTNADGRTLVLIIATAGGDIAQGLYSVDDDDKVALDVNPGAVVYVDAGSARSGTFWQKQSDGSFSQVYPQLFTTAAPVPISL